MSYVDIVVIALVVLFAGFGILRGVKKSALSLGAFLIAFLIAFFLAKPIAEGFLNIDGVRTFVLGTNGWSLYTWIYGKVGTDSEYLSAHFYQPISDIMAAFPGGYPAALSEAQGQALYIAFLIFSMIIGVALYIVLRILLCIATMIIKSFIGKRKTVAVRLFGFLVGAVRGGIWAIVIALIFSTMGGLTGVPVINTIQGEFDRAVIANYVNDAAYAIRNNIYLPNADMFARVVDKSGIIVKEEDKATDDYMLLGQEADLYTYFLNLNYKTDPYSVVDGTVVKDDQKALDTVKVSEYSHTGFDGVLTAVMDYNAAAAKYIEDGGLTDMTTSTLSSYLHVVQEQDRSISSVMFDIINSLYNYENYITENSALVTEEAVTSANGELETQYAAIRTLFSELETLYRGIPTFGTLEVGEYPSVVKVQVKA